MEFCRREAGGTTDDKLTKLAPLLFGAEKVEDMSAGLAGVVDGIVSVLQYAYTVSNAEGGRFTLADLSTLLKGLRDDASPAQGGETGQEAGFTAMRI